MASVLTIVGEIVPPAANATINCAANIHSC
jgi:hypothetical protein